MTEMTGTNYNTETFPTPSQPAPDRQELTITRIFDAPRELVFRAWTDPKHAAQWWCPKWFTNTVCELDVQPGGAILIDMRGPDGVVYPMKGVYHEVIEPERLVFTSMALEDEEGNPHLETLNTVTFAEHDGKTKLTMHAVVVKATSAAQGALSGMEEGWNQSLDKLAVELGELEKLGTPNGQAAGHKTHLIAEPGSHEIIVTRVFDAPRELVFKAHTDPKAIPQWWGPAKYKTTVEKMEAKPGGSWRFIQASSDGNEFAFHGVYHDVVAPERIVQTFEFEGAPGHVALETATFEEQDGKTTLTYRSVFQLVEDRDAMIQEGMESGLDEGMNRLTELLKRS